MNSTSGMDPAQAARTLAALTERQTAVMELAAQHKSNKLIAQELDISPSTVEQRMGYVKDKLETPDRNATIRRFVELRAICGEPIYGFAHLEIPPETQQSLQQEVGREGFRPPAGFLEAYDQRFGRSGRFVLVIVTAFALALLALLMMSLATSLSVLI